MNIEKLALPGVYVFEPKRFGDDRGFFSETFSMRAFNEVVPGLTFVQDNHSLSRDKGVIRGMHFQTPPDAQGKLVRVTAGRVLDVIVDIRKGSPTYGQHVGVELSAENWKQLWVPAGFAHAFCTLEENTEFLYKVTDFYAPQSDAGIAFDDPDLGIDWPIDTSEAILSDKDRNLPRLKDIESPFVYEGE
ncbi:dTDP-4-dehydrorhamnose 3,5-epimerase [Kordiimonas sp. SCSIO 12610]|uniref:dTDP-4-dehydrorhamnose 3,5-epimerase n=1 Tax=Kordiimonas sp. SCSIO 12610 TaxID=2829597 RepID=UPI00210A631C|nr:dTDP-4-dehydrorhamnose 3,5-epimerase [Kordiimonas sp. SCSIO 12610]UTW56274.1 dTDP-4-dehydrorhamnose 3,5-epimerase [Kordiimonas sp. SCSIO 12610]